MTKRKQKKIELVSRPDQLQDLKLNGVHQNGETALLSAEDMDTDFLANDNILEEALASAVGQEGELPDTSLLDQLDPPPPINATQQQAASQEPPTQGQVPPAALAASLNPQLRLATGRPCEICGFEPKTKNKSRERQDHLAMKHYRERIQQDLANCTNFVCPICNYTGKDKQTIYRHYTGKHKVVEQYLADDIASGKVIPLSQKQNSGTNAILNGVSGGGDLGAASTPAVMGGPRPVAQRNSGSSGSIDLSRLDELMAEPPPLATSMPNPLAHVNGMPTPLAPVAAGQNGVDRIMQVDGAFDEEVDEDKSETSCQVAQLDGLDDTDTEADLSFGLASNGSLSGTQREREDVLCPICQEPTKLHKTYHLATKHFKNRLVEILPDSQPFRCPECSHESKTKINMWTHYLGKHKHGNAWTKELLALRANGYHGMMFDAKAPAPPMDTTAVQSGSQPASSSSFLEEIKSEPSGEGAVAGAITPSNVNSIKQEMMTLQTPSDATVPSATGMTPSQLPPPASNTTTSPAVPETNSLVTSTPAAPPAQNGSLTATNPADVKVEAKPAFTKLSTCAPGVQSTLVRSHHSLVGSIESFWCDLCQDVVSGTSRAHHFVGTHFTERLKQVLPSSGNGPFACPLCKFESKHFFNLGVHYLTKHNLLESWIEKAREKMEDEAMAKAEENEAKGLLPDGSKDLKRQNDFMSSGEETDSNVSLSIEP